MIEEMMCMLDGVAGRGGEGDKLTRTDIMYLPRPCIHNTDTFWQKILS